MIVLIPLGGSGERFKKHNYKKPKALINIFGKPILYYLLDNLKLDNVEYVYIPYNKEYEHYRFESELKKRYPNIKFKFLCLEEQSRGAAHTLNIALLNIDTENDKPILCLDGDNFYTNDIIQKWDGQNKIFCFHDDSYIPIYSYIKTNNNYIIDIVEKEKISNLACTGAYGFNSYKNLLKYTKLILNNNDDNKEYYISDVIKYMIKNHYFLYNIIDKKQWTCLGTPIQIRQFYNNYPKITIHTDENITEKRYCFDLDNTLVTYPEIYGDYASVKPIQKNIDFLKYLKTFNHTIIIHTARRMKTHKGNVGKIMADIGKITFDTLDKFDIPYDEIYFGKPEADYYIDDKAINCFDDLEKELGYYMDHIEPRTFNDISQNVIEVYKKESNDLSGEIYYYNNIPRGLKDLFPILIDYHKEYKSYMMEKIQGLTCANLYVSELLTNENLIHIMNSLNRIHNHKKYPSQKHINIYGNYKDKLKQRYNQYDYSLFNNSEYTYNTIINELTRYETNENGTRGIIHGDPVMTNIIINNYDKIKFIDMRGKINDVLTNEGDIFYDWAKLYQSLIGYDKILLGKIINKTYEKEMISVFERYIIDKFSVPSLINIKLITKSLLFSLLPLHDDKSKCNDFYELIKKIK